ncbi:MAG: hypothetical protein PHF16_03315, partial [Atribacterota bacterium]|nr:hypothetical protein [Atribacterota bacterium]
NNSRKSNKHLLHIETDINHIDKQSLKDLKKIFKKYPGQNNVIIHFKSPQKIYRQQTDDRIGYNEKIISEIKNVLNYSRVWFEDSE